MGRPLGASLMTTLSIGAVALVASAAAASPIRIVSLAPGVTETLFALGKGAAVVGV
jgi:ABC-type hemin transport system substrate-binding protein